MKQLYLATLSATVIVLALYLLPIDRERYDELQSTLHEIPHLIFGWA